MDSPLPTRDDYPVPPVERSSPQEEFTGASFFITGGTLPRDAACYVERVADRDIFNALAIGEYCYVLTARQMGKSSLMVRTATRLRREQGAIVALLDLTAVGQNLSPAQWYRSLLGRLGRQLNIEEELDQRWRAGEGEGPLQRWSDTVFETLLDHFPGQSIVLFVDEIDATRSLPFPAAEFFGAIRECYNRRSDNPEYARISFCLMGVASPSQLIDDPRMSPFNIGKRIEVTDFTADEAQPLAAGLVNSSRAVLARVLYWTGGHPYLTQRLCRAAEESGAAVPADVDRLCGRLFFGRAVRDIDDNLLFVQDRLLRSDEDLSALLTLYGQIQSGRRVSVAATTSALSEALRLSGVVSADASGKWRVRNRIYGKVFDGKWVNENLPGAEMRRQRAAVASARWQIGSIAMVIVLALVMLTSWALKNAHLASANARESAINSRRADAAVVEAKVNEERARREAKRANTGFLAAKASEQGYVTLSQAYKLALVHSAQSIVRANRSAEIARQDTQRALLAEAKATKQAERADKLLYTADMNLMRVAWEAKEILVARIQELLDETRSSSSRNFEWGYWNHLIHSDLLTIGGKNLRVYGAVFSPDDRRIAMVSTGNTVRVCDAVTGRQLLTLKGQGLGDNDVAFSPDSKRIVAGSVDNAAIVSDASTGRKLLTLKGHHFYTDAAAFSPDGKRIVTGGWDSTARVWDADTGDELLTLHAHKPVVRCVSFSPDSKRIITGGSDKTAKVWDALTGRELLTLTGHTKELFSASYSPDGKTILTASSDGTLRIWSALTGLELRTIRIQDDFNSQVASYSPDGRRIVSGSRDGVARIRDTSSGKELQKFVGQSGGFSRVSYSPDGRKILTSSADGTAKVWSTTEEAKDTLALERSNGTGIFGSAVPQTKRIIIGNATGLTVWDSSLGKRVFTVRHHFGDFATVSIAPDGNRFAVACDDGTTIVYAAPTGEELLALRGHGRLVTSVAFSPDSKQIVTADFNLTASVWDAFTGRELYTLKLAAKPRVIAAPCSASFSPDGRRIVTGSHKVQVWDASTGKLELTLGSRDRGGPQDYFKVVFSPDGRRIAAGSNLGGAEIWDMTTRQLISEIKGQYSSVELAVFSPDGKRIVTGDGDTANVWDTSTGRELLTLRGHKGDVLSVAFSTDGTRVYTSGADNTVRTWIGDWRQ